MERDYIFGTTDRNGLTVENLKTVGDTHTALTCGSFTQVRREYPDCVITDLFRVDEQYGSTEAGGICYDFYAISEHWRNVDKTPEPESVEPQEQISEEDTTLDMLADHEYRLCMMELGAV